MRIAMISTPFVSVPPKDYGGTERVVYELVEGLGGRGHDVTLFAPRDSRTSAELRSLYAEACWPPDPMHDMNHVSWAMRQVRDERFDIVHVHSACALALSRLMSEIPLLYTLHHVRDETLSSFYRYFPDPQYIAISVDQASREEPLPHVHVIHHGLDPEHYEWSETPADYVCFIGRFSEIKGPHTAIDVAERAGVPIRVAGEIHVVDREFGEREVLPRLEKTHVTYLGCIGMDGKVPFFRDARALLMPIAWNEPFGLVMIEAMLSGCPVIAFPWGSVPEVVEEGVTGFVVQNEREMQAIIRPGGRLEHFDRRRCRERAVERFGSARMVEEHEALYQRVLGRSPATRASRIASAMRQLRAGRRNPGRAIAPERGAVQP
jgi:glycosyltransferase involved in cell wall biosynthesis